MTASRAKTWVGVAPLPVLPHPDPLRAGVVTEWGVRYRRHAVVGHVKECGSEAVARRWLAKLLFCGNLDATLVARAAGVGAAWISMGGAL